MSAPEGAEHTAEGLTTASMERRQMATSPNTTNPSRFHNISDQALADAIGAADAVLKAAEAECKALKDEFKARGLEEVSGDKFTVTAKTRLRAGSIPQPSRSSSAMVTPASSGR